MTAYDFDRAIVREPARSVVDGLRADTTAQPTYEGVAREHAAYSAALHAAGLAVDVLPRLEAFPDSVFVEDPALLFTEGAILLRPGAPSRTGESVEMRPALHRHFDRVLELARDEFTDGGDVLVTGEAVFVGISARTTRKGAEALVSALAKLGHKGRVAATPEKILHFKTAVALLDEETLLAMPQMADSEALSGFRVLTTPAGEDAAANALRINDTVFIGAGYPRTIELVRKHGYKVQPLSVGEVAKLDAGLSCMSLRWKSKS